jgi:hypothetical protein
LRGEELTEGGEEGVAWRAKTMEESESRAASIQERLLLACRRERPRRVSCPLYIHTPTAHAVFLRVEP